MKQKRLSLSLCSTLVHRHTNKMTAMKLSAWAYESGLIHYLWFIHVAWLRLLLLLIVLVGSTTNAVAICLLFYQVSIWQLCENDVHIWPSFSVSKSLRCVIFVFIVIAIFSDDCVSFDFNTFLFANSIFMASKKREFFSCAKEWYG